MREAAGVVGAITPFNVPFYVNIEKAVSALLAGCTVVLKPAPDTPALGAIWGETAIEAGFPAGVLNVVTGKDPALGELLVIDPRVDLITFTGSSAVGKRIMEKGAPTLKRVLLELGGKSAKIILDDVPDFAREVASSIITGHSGQGCTTRSRLLVPASRFAEAVKILKATYAAYEGKWGIYDDPQDAMGPVISQRQMERIKADIDLGVQEGATLIAGGNISSTKKGFFIEPTCFVDVTNDMAIARQEVFGPVLWCYRMRTTTMPCVSPTIVNTAFRVASLRAISNARLSSPAAFAAAPSASMAVGASTATFPLAVTSRAALARPGVSRAYRNTPRLRSWPIAFRPDPRSMMGPDNPPKLRNVCKMRHPNDPPETEGPSSPLCAKAEICLSQRA